MEPAGISATWVRQMLADYRTRQNMSDELFRRGHGNKVLLDNAVHDILTQLETAYDLYRLMERLLKEEQLYRLLMESTHG